MKLVWNNFDLQMTIFFVTDEVIDIFEIFLENKYFCNFY